MILKLTKEYEIFIAIKSLDQNNPTEASSPLKTLASKPRDIGSPSWNELIKILPKYFDLLGLLNTNNGLK